MHYKVLIFDFFGVISSEVASVWFEEHVPRPNKMELKEKYVGPADKGQLTQEELFEDLSKVSGMHPDEIETDWVSHAQINLDVVAFIKELKGRYRLGLLTNAFSPFFTTVLERSDAKDLFETIVMSGETGFVKPEPEMYETILRKMNVQPEEALMIDDNLVNVEGAKKVGMGGLVFTSLEQLEEDLEG